ncbi:hypothetical protein CRG98_031489 [Punica granatum]|uniref:Uncharacterized protein n=1 Tax=Punica granatum TaxID=22663 RepID=A0A2I0IVV4_PUNGR|nr:hypothetical protein CRG98_031489 [Punica granatum]
MARPRAIITADLFNFRQLPAFLRFATLLKSHATGLTAFDRETGSPFDPRRRYQINGPQDSSNSPTR